MLKVVVDTNLWIRVLLGGQVTTPLLEAWRSAKFHSITSEELLAELEKVWQRPRLKKHIDSQDAQDLIDQLRYRSTVVVLKTTPPHCRDPKDQPVLATAIDGNAEAIATGDADLRADDALRKAMAGYGVEIFGIESLLEKLSAQDTDLEK